MRSRTRHNRGRRQHAVSHPVRSRSLHRQLTHIHATLNSLVATLASIKCIPADTTEPDTEAAPPPPENYLHRHGANWEVRFRGKHPFWITHGDGATYLSIILATPCRDWSRTYLMEKAGKLPALPKASEQIGKMNDAIREETEGLYFGSPRPLENLPAIDRRKALAYKERIETELSTPGLGRRRTELLTEKLKELDHFLARTDGADPVPLSRGGQGRTRKELIARQRQVEAELGSWGLPPDRNAELKEELQELNDLLAQPETPNTGTGREKGDTAIGMAIDRTIKQIAKYGYTDLAAHLKTSIRPLFGRAPSYKPAEMTYWETDHSMLSSRGM